MALRQESGSIGVRFVRAAFSHARASWVALVVYSIVAAATCVVGTRVVRTKWFYSGTYEDNYFAGLQPVDALIFVGLFAAVLAGTAVVLGVYRMLLARVPLRKVAADPTVVFCVSWVVIFLCWVPYLLANFPCSLYADSIVIIKQALGINALTSHHPIAYVALVGVFLNIGDVLFGSYITGLALYATFQMAFMSGVFAYLLAWMARRRVSLVAILAFGAIFALLSIFPLHAVSMWKDGLYAAFVLRVSLLLFDIAASRGDALESPGVCVRLALWGAAVTLVRSNGIYVMACVWAVCLLLYLVRRTPRADGSLLMRVRWELLSAAALSLAIYVFVVGPLSSLLDVGTEPVESYGIPLQQVAAVVIYDGEMTPEQEEFVDTLLPLGEYADEYIPCSVDGIKWADNFDTAFFNDHQADFLRVWAQMAPANAGIYAAAYIMESYEYWSFADVARTFTLNGVNDKYDAPDLGIIETNLLKEWFGDTVNDLFPFKFFHLQEGAQSWIVLFGGLLLFVARRDRWVGTGAVSGAFRGRHAAPGSNFGGEAPFARAWWLVLLPTVANWLTVLISSPFAALPRYILPAVFLLPVVVVLPWLVWAAAGEGSIPVAASPEATGTVEAAPAAATPHSNPGAGDTKALAAGRALV